MSRAKYRPGDRFMYDSSPRSVPDPPPAAWWEHHPYWAIVVVVLCLMSLSFLVQAAT